MGNLQSSEGLGRTRAIDNVNNETESSRGRTLRWVQSQQEGQPSRRRDSAPPRLETTSQGYQEAFLGTLQNNLGDRGRQLIQRIAERRSSSAPGHLDENIVESTVVGSNDSLSLDASSGSLTVQSSMTSNLSELLESCNIA